MSSFARFVTLRLGSNTICLKHIDSRQAIKRNTRVFLEPNLFTSHTSLQPLWIVAAVPHSGSVLAALCISLAVQGLCHVWSELLFLSKGFLKVVVHVVVSPNLYCHLTLLQLVSYCPPLAVLCLL